MSPSFFVSNEPIQSLQEMLRTIAFVDRSIPFFRSTGQFDEATLEAVMTFQKGYDLPVTGIVDRDTWDGIVKIFLRSWGKLSSPTAQSLFTSEMPDIHPGQTSHLIPLVQNMFCSLAQVLNGLTVAPSTGILDKDTEANLRLVQNRANLPDTGILNKETWNVLVRLFRTFSSPSSPIVIQAGDGK